MYCILVEIFWLRFLMIDGCFVIYYGWDIIWIIGLWGLRRENSSFKINILLFMSMEWIWFGVVWSWSCIYDGGEVMDGDLRVIWVII